MIASVLLEVTRPAATFWMRRSLPAVPTLTTPLAPLAPAKLLNVWPPIVAELTEPVPPVAEFAVPIVAELLPRATELVTLATDW
ncbi:hypothetical protein BLA13014_05214 [Burkholderia aenigmatica]|uniref:DNA-directed RNA polymerase II n=1 Tax=Burkholderia aenigmatica TaxID=2015348 RepID=A0A6P2PYA9_9BURK|nr:hypothetical protein BLA13014_05214 [Burkholderia aenigmatica]